MLRTGFYNITNSRGKVAKFCLFKQAYRIGDDIVGTCDFNDATVACVQVSHVTGDGGVGGSKVRRLGGGQRSEPGVGGVSVHSDAQFTVMLSRAWVVSQFTVTLSSQ